MFWPFRRRKKNQVPDNSWVNRYITNSITFKKYNEHRIEYIRSQLPDKKLQVFNLIPALIHENTALSLSCAGNNSIICGISCFSLTQRQKKLLAIYFPDAKTNASARPSLPVIFLSVMGSAGTIAFTGESDIDFWVGVETEKHTPENLAAFKHKLKSIEEWALAQSGLEVHFFITDIAKIRKDDYGVAEGESCGSALGKLLKDEFYRTAIFLCGKAPYYWVIPSGADDITYREIVERLEKEDIFPHQDYIDIGPISLIYSEEYNGAALWQMLKGLSSPFKSVIKTALLEKYANESDDIPPLCEVYKKEIHNSVNLLYPDPYLFMMESIRAYYIKQNNTELRQLMEKCFLIRSTLTAGKGISSGNETIARFNEIGRAWGYTTDEITDIMLFREWDFSRNEELSNHIRTFFIETYNRIRARVPANSRHISIHDFSVIGKKLGVFFKNSQGKIPFLFSLLQAKYISGIVIEEELHYNQASLWNVKVLIKGLGRENIRTVKSMEHPIAALAFLSLNNLFTSGQNFILKGKLKLTKNDAIHFIESIRSFFPCKEIDTLGASETLADPIITHLYIWANWNMPEWNYGIASVLALTYNTYGEMHYFGINSEKYITYLKTLLTENIGIKNLKSLQYKIHRPKEKIIARLRLSDQLENQIKAIFVEINHQYY